MTKIYIEELTDLSQKTLIKAGLKETHAARAIDHYLENEFSGKASHGLIRIVEALKALKKYGLSNADAITEFENEQVLRMDAQRQLAPIACWQALEKGFLKAQHNALIYIGVRNYIASSGSLAYYLKRCAEKGLIALAGCNSVALVAHPTSKKRQLGTNPFGIAIPNPDGAPMIADFATSAIAYGKIMVMKDKGEAVPEGKLIDKAGIPSTNPEDAYNGAILPLADYRGFALGMMIELLAGPLIGAKAIKNELYDNDGLYFILINPEHFGAPDIQNHISASLQQILSAPLAPDHNEITLPGQRSDARLKQTLENGYIDVAEKTLNDLKTFL